jgi:hypothetical protein
MGDTRTYCMHVSDEMPGFTVVQPMPLAFPSLHSGGNNSFFSFYFDVKIQGSFEFNDFQ